MNPSDQTAAAGGRDTQPVISLFETGILLLLLYCTHLTARYGYLLFHSVAESFTIFVAMTIFLIVINTWRGITNQYFLFVGVAYGFIAVLDTLHTLSYKGMGVFTDYGYYAPELWIAARYMESISMVLGFFFLGGNRRLNVPWLVAAYLLITAGLVLSIFYFRNFPVCFVAGKGLTTFKVVSEYVICAFLALSLVLLHVYRRFFESRVYRVIQLSILAMIITELCFTLYVSDTMSDFFNQLGHLFKIVAFYLIYKAVVVTALRDPVHLLSRELDASKRELATKRLLDSVVENIPTMVFLKRADDLRFELFNRAGESLIGIPRDQMIGHNDYDFFPREQAEFFMQKDREVLGSHEVIEVPEEKIETARGPRYLHTKKVALRDARGRPQYLLGISEDITERKRAEEQQLLAASVFKNSHNGIIITDANNRIINTNSSFSRITGYDEEEVLGQNPGILSSGRHGKAFYAEMWTAIKENGHWQGEIWNRRKNGDIFIELLSISTVRSPEGAVQNHIGVFTDISLIKEHEAELDRAAHYDPLTGVPNQTLCLDRLQQAIKRNRRTGRQLAVCYLDIDDFKPINERYGHEAGDQILIRVTHELQEVLRDGDTIARVGGDEFVLLLSELSGLEECYLLLDRILTVVRNPMELDGVVHQVSISAGVTLYPPDIEDADGLLRHANQAMYLAKSAGRDNYHFHDPEQERLIQNRHLKQERLAEALRQNEFVLHYQPKVDLVSREVIGAEALIRWQHPEKGILPPADFLADIDGSDLEVPIGEWVIESALRQIVEWSNQGLSLVVSVNIGARHLLRPDFAERLRGLLAAHPEARPGDLELEILETAALSDMELASRVLFACHALGVRFALDDFGTGYSSLAYFRTLPIDVLKIDQSFVRDMLEDPNDLEIVESVIKLAQAFNRPVIAEGVETLEHGALLTLLGCRLCQGYGIARPMPSESLTGWVTDWSNRGDRIDVSWPINRNDIPLMVAAENHQQWVIDLVDNLDQANAANPPKIDPHLCGFGRWYGGGGASRYGKFEEFRAIAPIHDRVHAIAADLLELVKQGDLEVAKNRLPELYAARDELLNRLYSLVGKIKSANADAGQ